MTFSCYDWVPVRSLRLVRVFQQSLARSLHFTLCCDYRSLGMTGIFIYRLMLRARTGQRIT